MTRPAADPTRFIKLFITLAAAVALVVRIVFPDLRIDAVSLGLIAIAILPWLAPLIKRAELPGGLKIEFQDVKAAADKVSAGEPDVPPPSGTTPEPSYLAVVDHDPSLALVGLRIEIEKRLRTLAELAGIPKSRPLPTLTHDLQGKGVLHPDSAGGLRDLITLGNQAAHGVEVGSQVASSAVEYGPRVLQILDGKIEQLGGTA